MTIITPELAEICGIHAGDGYLRFRERNKGEVEISGNIEEKEYYDNHVIPLFNKIFQTEIRGRTFQKGTYGFVTYNKQIRKTLKKLGFPSGKKSKIVRIPTKILENKDKEIYCKFLRGIFDTDGHLGFRKYYGKSSKLKKENHHYPTIHLCTISKNFSKDISKILESLKIKHFIHKYTPKKDKRGFNAQTRYNIIINGTNRLEKWMKLIGIKNPVKYSRYLVWKKMGFCKTNTTLKERTNILKGELDINSKDP